MHFLCLHGIGTNNKIFEAQTAALRFELGEEHTYDFVEGSLPCEAASGLERFVPTADRTAQYYAHFDWFSASSVIEALDYLSSHIATHGPYDGVIAFSQGSCLASTLMLQHHRDDPDDAMPLFKCAIFFSGILPFDIDALAAGQRKQVGKINPAEAEYCDSSSDDESDLEDILDAFRIPTAHIWGTNDQNPLPQGDRLYQLCPGPLRLSVTHQEGHSIPGRRNDAVLKKVVRAIRKTIERAEMVH